MGNSFTTSLATASGTDYLTLAQARQLARKAVQVNASTYTDTEVDLCLSYIGNDFVEATRCAIGSGTVAVGTTTHVAMSGLTGFDPAKAVRFTVIDYQGIEKGIERVGWDEMLTEIAALGTTVTTGTSIPTKIAFLDSETARINAAPGTAAQSIRATWLDQFTQWTAGGTVTTTELNIPRRMAYQVFHDGAGAVLSIQDPTARMRSEGWRSYLAHRERCKAYPGNDRGVIRANQDNYL